MVPDRATQLDLPAINTIYIYAAYSNIFMRRLGGGELFERIAKKGAFPEDIARHHMKSLTQCIQVRIHYYIWKFILRQLKANQLNFF